MKVLLFSEEILYCPERLKQLQKNVQTALAEQPNAKVEWIQSATSSRGTSHVVLTAVVTMN